MATLLAPQFWLGGAGPLDVVRRLTLSLAYRAPRIDDYRALAQTQPGSDEFKTGVRELVRRLRGERARRPGEAAPYVRAVQSWHREWLGLRNITADFAREAFGDFRGQKYLWAWDTAAGLAGQLFTVAPSGDPNRLKIVTYGQNFNEHGNSEACDASEPDQEFNADTARIEYQQRRPGDSTWKKLGAFYKDASGRWQLEPGEILGTDGQPIGLADVTIPIRQGDGLFHYPATSRLAGTGYDKIAVGDRRIVRYARRTDGSLEAQTGYSWVNLWWSGKRVRVCNGLSRFIASCSFRPVRDRVQVGAGITGEFPYIPADFPYYSPELWKDFPATRAAVDRFLTADSQSTVLDTIANPLVLDNYRCGTPDPDAVNEDAAFPKAAPYNPIASNIRIAFWIPQTWLEQFPRERNPEWSALQQALEDMQREPDELVRHILEESRDYRQLLTANFTFGRGPLELLYRTQAHYFPTYPRGSYRRPGDAAWESSRMIDPRVFTPVSRKWMSNSYGGSTSYWMAGPDEGVVARPFSGILTQAAFLKPGGVKLRGIASRIFQTLTCEGLNSFVPDATQATLHKQYIPRTEAAGNAHVDLTQNCYSCHVNMDPLAAALSKNFLDVRSDTPDPFLASGEMHYFAIADARAGATYGIRGSASSPSRGALLGKPITGGVREVGQVLSESPQFARCATRWAFEGLVGRPPQGNEELKLIRSIGDRFGSELNYDYDRLVEELATSDAYLREE